MADSSPKLHRKGDAARRLFMIPELLENILDQVAQAEIKKKQKDPFLPNAPVRSLYRLLRVNKTFRNTIFGSALLQRHMWLRPSDVVLDSDEEEWRYCTRVEWLLSKMSLNDEEFETGTASDWGIEPTQTGPRFSFVIDCGSMTVVDFDRMKQQVRAFRRFVDKYGAEGSWRDIGTQVCSEDVTIYLEIVLHQQGPCCRWSHQREFTSSATLGTVFDTYRELIKPFDNYLEACALAKEKFFEDLERVE